MSHVILKAYLFGYKHLLSQLNDVYLHVAVCIRRKENIWKTKLQEKLCFKAHCHLLNALAYGGLAFCTA